MTWVPVVAYMNPGAGGLLLQILLVTAAGAFVMIRSYWHHIKAFFAKKK